MIGQFIAKQVAGAVVKKVMEKRAIKKMRDYVEKPNDLDKQVKQMQKTISKQGRYIEELQKDVAQLKAESHPPIKGLERRLKKLEKK